MPIFMQPTSESEYHGAGRLKLAQGIIKTLALHERHTNIVLPDRIDLLSRERRNGRLRRLGRAWTLVLLRRAEESRCQRQKHATG